MRSPSPRPVLDLDTDRAQTGIDFLVGATVFLVAVGFVFAFLPTMFDPFVQTDTDNALIADRAASQLAEGVLVDEETPAVLNDTKMSTFFSSCTNDSVGDDLGLDTDRIRIELDGVYDCGEEPPFGSSVTISQRVVLNETTGDYHRLTVEVW